MNNSPRTIILGAGLAGLACGYELAKLDKPIIIYEKEDQIGGLSRTIWIKTAYGDFGFDFGGHRFLTREKEIEAFFFEIIGIGYIEKRNRSSHIFLKGRYFDYPIKPFTALLQMPFSLTIKAGITYWYAFFRYFYARRKIIDNFEDWVKFRFGSVLYNLFFRDYTQKAWGISPRTISSIWAAERIKATSFLSIIKNSLLPPSPESKIALTLYKQFYYPSRGIQVLSDLMAEKITTNGHNIICNSELTNISINDGQINSIEFSNGDKIKNFDNIVSSIPLPDLIAAMGDAVPSEVKTAAQKLIYRDLILVGIMLNKPEALQDSWLYFPEDQFLFVRISEPSKYGSKMCPPNKTAIAAEITCNQGDKIWKMSDVDIIEKVKSQLIQLKFVNEPEVIGSFVKRITHAYPIFDLNFQENLTTILAFLSRFENLELIGRTGTFQYLNMDLALLHGRKCAFKLAGLSKDSVLEISHDHKWVG
ncbi:MAG: FAD-binding protein [Asgard group archaeon]|nr:FAD-binding protein [Asgard group archaeon]